MGKFDEILICTDLDGTLLSSDKTISRQNIEAIEYFKSHGGYFTFVTGRMPFFASDFYNIINPNAPFGCINGGGLYDHKNNKYIWTRGIEAEVTELIKTVEETIPNIGIQPNSFINVYFSKDNYSMKRFRELTGAPNLVRSYTEIEEPLAKIVFGLDTEDDMNLIIKVLNSHPIADKFDFIRSEKNLYEILPKGISKGTSITKLSEYLSLSQGKIIAVGDYNNDIPMFKEASLGIAVSNACDDALNAADLITVSNDENAIAQIIYDIESKKISL